MLNKFELTTENDRAMALALTLKDLHCSLPERDFFETNIADDGANALAEALKVNRNLKEIDLSNSEIGDAGASTIADALRVISSVTKISFYGNEIGDAGASAIAEALKKNSALQTIRLLINDFGKAGASAIGDALFHLIKIGIFDPNYGHAIILHKNPIQMACAISYLRDEESLAHVETVANSDNPFDLARALCILVRRMASTPSNIDAVAKHVFPISLAYALSFLKEVEILNDANRQSEYLKALVDHTNLDDLADALLHLSEKRILSHENVVEVIAHGKPRALANALSHLNDAQNLTDKNRLAVANHPIPVSLATALSHLNDAQILTDANRLAVAKHDNIIALAVVLSCLKEAGILTAENIPIVFNQDKPSEFSCVLRCLKNAGILTSDNLVSLVLPIHAELLTKETIRDVWNKIPSRLLTPANFQRLLTASKLMEPQVLIFIRKIIVEEKSDYAAYATLRQRPLEEHEVLIFNRKIIVEEKSDYAAYATPRDQYDSDEPAYATPRDQHFFAANSENKGATDERPGLKAKK